MDYLIIGGGIVGLATAYQLQNINPDCKVTLLEKESDVGQHQSGHNSGVLHCGLYYKPGSIKAELALRGIRQMVDFCDRFNIKHEICGKLVVACTAEEEFRLKNLQERGSKNGLKGLKYLNRNEMLEYEPSVGGVAALHVPQEGIVDYKAVCKKLKEIIISKGGIIKTCAKVHSINYSKSEWVVGSNAGNFISSYIINCAGLYCDRIAKISGEKRGNRIIPFRGEYYKLKKSSENIVKNLIYPVPDSQFPFLGVHFTRLINGGVEAGPNAVLAFSREGYSKSNINIYDIWDSLTFSGLWRFMLKYPRMTAHELLQSFSKKTFCSSLQKLVPSISMSDIEPGGAGVRAQAMSTEGELIQDFSLIIKKSAMHVLNAPSPAATASLAIGNKIATAIINQR